MPPNGIPPEVWDIIMSTAMDGAMPEYTSSRGGSYLPVDIGTLSQNLNYQQDVRRDLTDPFVGAMSGYFNPAVFEPTVEYAPIDPPEVPKLSLYSQSADESKQLMLARLNEGADPYQVGLELAEAGFLGEGDVADIEASPRFAAMLKDAQDIQGEIYQVQSYQQQVQNPQVVSSTPSAISQQFMDAGFTDPSIQYTDEQLNPAYAAAKAKEQSTGARFTETLRQIQGDGVREALMKHAGPVDWGDGGDKPTPGQGGSRIQRAGMAGANAVNDIVGGIAGDPGGAALGYADAVSRFNPARWGGEVAGKVGGAAWGWLNDDPDAEEPSKSEQTMADLVARVKADGGPGIAEKARTSFANYIQKNTKARDPITTAKNHQVSRKAQGNASLAEAKERLRTQLLRQSGRTPFTDEFMGRAGL